MKSKIIPIKVKVSSDYDYVKKVDDPRFLFKVSVVDPPVKNKANKKMLKLMAQYLGLDKSKLSIISGEKDEIKLIELHE